MQTTTLLFTTSLLAALASTQKTVVQTGEPEEFLPSFSLNPTQSSIVSKYANDVLSTIAAIETDPIASEFNAYLATATPFPSGAESIVSIVLQGNPIPTNADTEIPASLRNPLVSVYNGIASIAKADLTADPALSTVAPYYVVPAEASSAPKITEVISGTTGAGKTFATVATTTAAAARASGSVAGGVAGSGSGVASNSGSGRAAPSSSASTSPITSAKPVSGASRMSAGVGALLVVGMGFVALL